MKTFLLIILIVLFGEVTFAEEYNRIVHFGGWIDTDNDGQDTRQEVLERDSLIPVGYNSFGKINYGLWLCQYTGRLFIDPVKLDIDHRVPLKEAFISGGESWSEEKRIKYANYLGKNYHLVVVEAKSNREKGAKDIAVWLPEIRVREYIFAWALVKEKWNLCFDWEEVKILSKYRVLVDNVCEEK